jgi:hypothetical protein
MTTHEQLFLGGAPVVGFGDAGAVPPIEHVPVISTLIGATGGAILGALVKKGVGAAIGAVVGGLSGAIVAVAVAKATSNNPPPAWRRVQPTTTATGKTLDLSVKAGQQIAVAVVGPNGAPVSSTEVSQLHTILATLPASPANLPTKNFVEYPPGSRLPPDWPTDDNLGAGAYRATADVLADTPRTSRAIPPPSVLAIEIWVRP